MFCAFSKKNENPAFGMRRVVCNIVIKQKSRKSIQEDLNIATLFKQESYVESFSRKS